MIEYFNTDEKDIINLLVLDILKQDKNYQDLINKNKSKNDLQ